MEDGEGASIHHDALGENFVVHRDFREFLAVAEQRGRLRRVRETVDRTWEPGCLIKWMFQALPDDQRFGLMFENVEGSEITPRRAERSNDTGPPRGKF